jgi:hypothetical protein
MSWEDLLDDEGQQRALPWFGFHTVHGADRTWTVRGRRPPEHGWYLFETTGGRFCKLISETEPDPAYEEGQPILHGYVVGDRFIPDGARVDPDPDRLIEQTTQVFCVERGLGRFVRAAVVEDRVQQLIYMRQEWSVGPEAEVLAAYQDRRTSVNEIQGVTPALDLAFRWITCQRELAEARRAELERLRREEEAKRAEEERIKQAMKDAGTAVGRRVIAAHDFETAAREALLVSGAELLDVRDSFNRGEKVVQYRFRARRLECVVDQQLMRVVDAGVCLTDHNTGRKGDTLLTLESLPGVISEAMDLGKLVVWRHVDGDRDEYEEDW